LFSEVKESDEHLPDASRNSCAEHRYAGYPGATKGDLWRKFTGVSPSVNASDVTTQTAKRAGSPVRNVVSRRVRSETEILRGHG